MGTNRGRTGRRWNNARNTIIRTQHLCGICGQPVDKTRPYRLPNGKPDPQAPTVDHITPLHQLGIDAQQDLDRHGLTNLQLAHRKCNNSKGANHHAGHQRQERNSRNW